MTLINKLELNWAAVRLARLVMAAYTFSVTRQIRNESMTTEVFKASVQYGDLKGTSAADRAELIEYKTHQVIAGI